MWVNVNVGEKRRKKTFIEGLKHLRQKQLFNYQLYFSFTQDMFAQQQHHANLRSYINL